MKKKQRCLFKRFAALVAALVLVFSISSPALAAFNDNFALPTQSEFDNHPHQWYIVEYRGDVYFFPCSFRVGSSGASVGVGAPTSPFAVDFDTSSSAFYTFYYLDAIAPPWLLYRYPVPIGNGYASLGFVPDERALPTILASSAGVRYFVGDSSDLPLGSQGFYDSSSHSGSVSGFTYRLPAFYRSKVSNTSSWGMISGPSTYITSDNFSAFHNLTEFYPLSFYAGDYEYTLPYPCDKIIYSNHLIFASSLVRYNYGEFLISDFLPQVIVLRMNSSLFRSLYGNGYTSGSWFPADEDLQNELLHQFNIDSDKLSGFKSSLDSFTTTPSVDSGVTSGASGLLNGVFQNLGTFLFSVTLLCFGAVVLRMFIRKAVEG